MYKEIKANIWNFKDDIKVITTNGFVKKNGECVMGRGVAKQCKDNFPGIEYQLGMCITKWGNRIHIFGTSHIICFPVKHLWEQGADLALIESSALELSRICSDPYCWSHSPPSVVYMVRPGCGNGGRSWKDVKPILEKYLDDKFVVVEKNDSGI